MKKRLILMRHAEAGKRQPEQRDFDRQLSRIGNKQAKKMATFLKEQKWHPDCILYSAACRTANTAKIVAKELGIKQDSLIATTDLFNAPQNKIGEVIQSTEIPEDTKTLMVIAHNPGISQIAAACHWKAPVAYFPPAGMAGFDVETEDWSDFSPESCTCAFYKKPMYY